ncbi:hypothetical protein NUV26_34640 [Burkholderia pseudomultivorans]|uniref:hypothetical protein n=1 Tax=Burkholderia pseudomultivorans TaxID=1207504 RepID=UPI0001FDA78D|nr:hypothetical protein [Burkholderia pseudomultivorans]EGD05244.1 hypothetical protein B1M_07402 [Burkholderia sp. TJI49]AOI89385.1 hypothetical protein WS57_11615 [Burkholderia pseudomultivorans]KVC26931.1 hypothetical protein WS56_24205 [Burkholderia pseudomultivorans]KVC27974.1 hypothetical protein WS55_11075 [Burkholderia pseudomultivorans]KVC40980.1 hypothetical protein WS58_00610 [Burkholderia pseudomultivorans]
MTFSQTQPEFFSGFDAFDEPLPDDAGTPDDARVTSYQAVLQEPMMSLVGSTSDRPDVASVAILGYN